MSTGGLVLVVVGWTAGWLLLWRLPVPAVVSPALAAAISVVVPARNEESALPRLLASLGAQTWGPLEVIVVDDSSTDGTAEVARRAGASVVAAPPPPPGWLGKPWACHLGAAEATGERLVFLDADTWLAPVGLARLAGTHAMMADDGLLSVQPFHEVHRPHEQLSAICNVVPLMASGLATPGGARRCRLAFGPCLVTRPEALAAAGGFAAVRDQVVEDAALAGRYRAAGRPVRCLAGGEVVRFRMYPDSLGALVEGWTKNLSGGAVHAAPLHLLGAVLWVAAALSVTIDAAVDPGVVVLIAWIALVAQVWWMLRRIGSFHWLVAVLFPVAVLTFVALFLRSTVLRALGRAVTWRGRRITPARRSR